MTLVDQTVAAQTDTIAFEFDLQHSSKKIWRALTQPELLAQWLLPVVEGKVEPATAFMFKTQPYPGWDGTVHCRVVELEAEKKLSYTWVVGEMLNTVVTFTLTPTETGTRLNLVQSGFKPEQKQNFGGARYGWKMMGGKLEALLSTIE